MAKRVIKKTVCSNCFNEFITNEMYTVVRKTNRTLETCPYEYYTPYCKACIKDTSSYLRILEEPKQK